ncbi:Hsp20/alpha crystallin family protein [Candidatus Dojkabacteria bacterium]|nr:Hsp20/alpha crystallin family protein [Candidatus Dojkabacteria bacterium]
MRRLSVWNPWGMLPKGFLDLDEEWEAMSDIEMDVYEEGDQVVVKVKAPGFKKDEVDVSVESGKVTVVGNAQQEKEEEDKKRKYYRKEISKSSFTRSCVLPVDVVPDKANANFEDGVLTITLPKSEEAKPKKIKVDVS